MFVAPESPKKFRRKHSFLRYLPYIGNDSPPTRTKKVLEPKKFWALRSHKNFFRGRTNVPNKPRDVPRCPLSSARQYRSQVSKRINAARKIKNYLFLLVFTLFTLYRWWFPPKKGACAGKSFDFAESQKIFFLEVGQRFQSHQ